MTGDLTTADALAVLGIRRVSRVSDASDEPMSARAVLDGSHDADLTPAARRKIAACRALVRQSGTMERGRAFRSSRDLFREFGPHFTGLRREEFWAIMLDGKHRVLRSVRISVGTLTSSPVHPREVLRPAVACAAAAIVIVHNHPSGDPTPSCDDLAVTRRLAECADLFGIRLLDHVVIGEGTFISFADRGLL